MTDDFASVILDDGTARIRRIDPISPKKGRPSILETKVSTMGS